MTQEQADALIIGQIIYGTEINSEGEICTGISWKLTEGPISILRNNAKVREDWFLTEEDSIEIPKRMKAIHDAEPCKSLENCDESPDRRHFHRPKGFQRAK